MTNKPLLQTKKLCYYIKDKKILDSIDLKVYKGEFLSIIGPNGAGKSTLLKCLNRIITNWQGDIFLNQTQTKELNARQIANQIAYVPQLHGEAPAFKVRDFLLMSRYAHLSPLASPAQDDYQQLEDSLKMVGIAEFAERSLATLSGGERQKVFIAAALVQDSPILLLDEPITFLDPRYQYEINRLLKKLNHEKKLTIISVSHDINSAVLNSHRILALKDGKVICNESVKKFMNKEMLKKVFDTDFIMTKHPKTDIPIVVPEYQDL